MSYNGRRKSEVTGRDSDEQTIAEGEDISNGKSITLNNYNQYTLMLHVDGAIDITVEVSPDGGKNWFEIPESPFSYGSAQDDTKEMGYDADMIKLTGSNTSLVTAKVYGVY